MKKEEFEEKMETHFLEIENKNSDFVFKHCKDVIEECWFLIQCVSTDTIRKSYEANNIKINLKFFQVAVFIDIRSKQSFRCLCKGDWMMHYMLVRQISEAVEQLFFRMCAPSKEEYKIDNKIAGYLQKKYKCDIRKNMHKIKYSDEDGKKLDDIYKEVIHDWFRKKYQPFSNFLEEYKRKRLHIFSHANFHSIGMPEKLDKGYKFKYLEIVDEGNVNKIKGVFSDYVCLLSLIFKYLIDDLQQQGLQIDISQEFLDLLIKRQDEVKKSYKFQKK